MQTESVMFNMLCTSLPVLHKAAGTQRRRELDTTYIAARAGENSMLQPSFWTFINRSEVMLLSEYI